MPMLANPNIKLTMVIMPFMLYLWLRFLFT